MLTDRNVHRCACGAWKLRSRECPVCAIFVHEATVREWHLKRDIATAKAEADCIANRQAVLRGAA